MKLHRTILGLGVSLAALTYANGHFNSALAQDDVGEEAVETPLADSEEVVVTGSRLRTGYTTPTPVTVTTAEDLVTAAPTLVSEALNQLPQFKNSSRAQNASISSVRDNGASFLNLRGLGNQRTLVLLDGRRVVPSSTGGSPDVNLFPQDLLKRVEVVTGGASAAYGSDAVTGVVNFILDDEFEGLKVNYQAGLSSHGDGLSRQATVSYGTSFDDGAGHFIASAEYFNQDSVGPPGGRSWASAGWAIVANSAPPPTRLIADDVRFSNASFGGVILSGPLANTMFLPGGASAPFVRGQSAVGSTMIGGDGAYFEQALTAGIERTNLFARLNYSFGEVSAFVEGGYAVVVSSYDQVHNNHYNTNFFTIFRDNAFLPDDIRQRMIAAGVDRFNLGRIHRDWGFIHANAESETVRATAGLTWDFTEGWELSAYASRGTNRYVVETSNNQIWRNSFAAVDAVIDPASGRVVCRSTLLGLDPGCVPLNVFGEGAPSPEAVSYITGTATADLETEQDVFSISISGSPFSTWAGPVNTAFGVEYRKETAEQTSDPLSQSFRSGAGLRYFPAGLNGGLGGFYLANPQPLYGSVTVKEAFFEIDVPLAEGLTWAKSLSVNAGVRAIDYSTSGNVTPWKVGVSYEPFDDLRVRATASRDIRAPNVNELFSPPVNTQGNVFYGGITQGWIGKRLGNPTLAPEFADTITAGLVYRPSEVPGLGLSIDFFKIELSGAISQLTAQQTVDECAAGAAIACAQISRDASGGLVINAPTINLASIETTGVDFEASYVMELGAGELKTRALISYLDSYTFQTPGTNPIDRAGDIGITGTPHFSGVLAVSYSEGPWELFVQERYIGGGKIDNAAPDDQFSDDDVESVWYTDVTLKYTLEGEGDGPRVQVYGTINNVFGKTPPIVPTAPFSSYRATNFSLYDVMGTYFTVGARLQF